MHQHGESLINLSLGPTKSELAGWNKLCEKSSIEVYNVQLASPVSESVLVGEGAHGVPGGERLDVLPEGLHDVGGDDGLVDDDLEDVLPEPVGGHHEVALFVAVVPPRVLHPPLDRVALILMRNCISGI